MVAGGGMVASGGMIATSVIQSVAISSTSPLPNCTATVPFSFTFVATGGVAPYTWSLFSGTLQPGLGISTGGVLSGTCTNTSGTDTFVIQACDSEASPACATKQFQQTAQNTPPPTLVVCDSSSSPTCANPPSTGVTGTFYGYNFNAIGGTAPYSWTVTVGAIPTNMTLAASGSLSGFPSATGTFNYTVQVTDSTTPTAETATASFSDVISGFSGNPQTALEPQTWTTVHQGGQNSSTGNPCAITDTNCTYSLPKTCNAANHCIHEQLGFGSNDHPATLTGLYLAGCDWATAQLGSSYSGQPWYLWAEMENGATIAGDPRANGQPVLNTNYSALWVAPVKINGVTSPGCQSGGPGNNGTTNGVGSVTPYGPWTIPVSGNVSGQFQLGEVIQQASSGAEATILFYGCSTDAPPTYARPCVAGVTGASIGTVTTSGTTVTWQSGTQFTTGSQWNGLQIQINGTAIPNATIASVTSATSLQLTAALPTNYTSAVSYDVVTQTGPIQTGMIQGGTADGTHAWSGLTSGASFTPSSAPVANGYFRLTGQCSAGSGSGSPLTPGYPIGSNDTPCNALSNQVPCYHSIMDASVINNPTCTSPNDLASMFILKATVSSGPGYITIEQDGDNTSISGFALELAPGINQSMASALCNTYPTVNCGSPPEPLVFNCGACVRDHFFITGNDPGDPGQETFAASVPYPVDPTTGNHECPSYDYYFSGKQDNPALPLALGGIQATSYSSGCGDDTQYGVSAHSGGYTADEYFTIIKVHKNGTETHLYQVGNGADNLNPTPSTIVPGQINVGGNGLNGPHKISQAYGSSGGEGLFVGGVPVNTTSGVMTNLEVHSVRLSNDPGWRYLTGNSSYSPQIFGGYGCGNGKTSAMVPFSASSGTMSVGETVKQAGTGATAPLIWEQATTGSLTHQGLYLGTVTGTANGTGVWTGETSGATWTPNSSYASGFASNSQNCPMSWAMKKVLEIKWCLQCLINGAIIENMWPDGQTGESVAVDARVCSGGSDCLIINPVTGNPLTTTNDIRFTDSILRNAAGIFSISPRALGSGDGGGVSQGMNRFYGHNLAIYNTDQTQWGGSAGGDVVLYGSAGNNFINGTATRNSSNVATVTMPAGTLNPSPLSFITIGPQTANLFESNPTIPAGTIYVNYNGEREDPYGPIGTVGFPQGTTVFSGGTYDATWTTLTGAGTNGVWDCRGMTSPSANCTNTQGTTNIWAPMCNAGIYGSSMMIGSACQNCGVNANYPCPPAGYGNVALTLGAALTPSDIICEGTGNGAGQCGPANATIQSYALGILGISANDIAYVAGCTDSTFNTPAEPTNQNVYAATNGVSQNGGSLAACGPVTPTVSQTQNSLSLIYPNCGSAASTSSCQVNNALGFQKNFIMDHITNVTGGIARWVATNHGYNTQMQQNQITNSIIYFGGSGSGIFCVSGANCTNYEAAGTVANRGAYLTWDQQSNQIHHNAFVLPTQARAKLYTAVGLQGSTLCGPTSIYNTGGNCAQWINGSTLMPLTVGCSTTQTLDTNGVPECIGFTGFITGLTSFPSTDCTSANISACPLQSAPWGTFDYHGLALCTSCRSGLLNFFGSNILNPGPATDGFQLGACLSSSSSCAGGGNMESVDGALSRTQYVCTGSCGPGPWPD